MKTKEIPGQMSIFDFLNPEKAAGICKHSGHTCNMAELHKVANSLDDIHCPHRCCRECLYENWGARCNGVHKDDICTWESCTEEEVFDQLEEIFNIIGTRTDYSKSEYILKFKIHKGEWEIGPFDHYETSVRSEKRFMYANWKIKKAPFKGGGNPTESFAELVAYIENISKIENQKGKILSVDIKGLCDDAYCPKCGTCLDENQFCDKECPVCHTQLDWKPWHVLNDEWYLKNKEHMNG